MASKAQLALDKRIYDKKRCARLKDHLREQSKQYRLKNREVLTTKKRAYYLANSEELRQRARDKRASGHYKVSEQAKNHKEEQRLIARTGFTGALITHALHVQGHVCAICGCDLKTKQRRLWHADHCHETMKPRGILCGPCNMGLGLFKDNIDRLYAAIHYLKNPPLVMSK
jgi:hypothetical protein